MASCPFGKAPDSEGGDQMVSSRSTSEGTAAGPEVGPHCLLLDQAQADPLCPTVSASDPRLEGGRSW